MDRDRTSQDLPQSPGVAGQTPQLSFLRLAVLAGLMLLFANFFFYAWAVKFGGIDDTIRSLGTSAPGPRLRSWPQLDRELRLYWEAGYDVVGLASGYVWRACAFMEEYAPFFRLMLLRGWGLAQTAPFYLLVLALALIEGRVRHHEKVLAFANISSTRYHLFFRLSAFMLLVGPVLFLALPFGGRIPGLGEIPLLRRFGVGGLGFDVWLSSPTLWWAVSSPFLFLCFHEISSNFTGNI